MTAARYPEYTEAAHCAKPGVDPERFLPRQGDNRYTLKSTKAICTGGGDGPACPFLDPCLAYALTHTVQGIWAGTTAEERRRTRERAGIAAVPLTFADLPRCGPGWTSDAPHGTPGAIAGHYRRGETCCDICKIKRREIGAANRAKKKAAS